MPKNIVVFSDGTGQGGGLLFDENRSNVYKLFRAARVCTDTNIDPAEQVAFYDPGLGSKAAGGGIHIGWWRRIYNILSAATGLGITQNIIDCYAAILRVWEPGDRIFLIGFSRGAYTVRCLAGALAYCGIPTRMPDGRPLKRDPATVGAIAREAIKDVYQFGSSKAGDPYREVRLELADRFRRLHGSAAPNDPMLSNAYPYFIGVWDTVATLGLTPKRTLSLIGGVTLTLGLLAVAGTAVRAALSPREDFDLHTYGSALATTIGIAAALAVLAYLWNYVKFTTKSRRPWYETLHVTGWHMEFYDQKLSPHVQHARHALSIDENRADFDRVPWVADTGRGPEIATTTQKDGYTQLIQMWFPGVHADVGGGYVENEARLSDIALEWMIGQATELPKPLKVDRSLLRLWPAANGPQHDERKSFGAGLPAWIGRPLSKLGLIEFFRWKPLTRRIPEDAPLHPSVLERLALTEPGALHYDTRQLYRPEALRAHRDACHHYTASAPPPKP